MPTVAELLQRRLQEAVTDAGYAAEEPLQVVPTAEAARGHYQSNAALLLAKRARANPRAIATSIAAHFVSAGLSFPPETAGPGFINFRLTPEFMAERLAELGRDSRLGVAPAIPHKKIIIDFSSPNIAKPLHVGHIRSTVLGEALARIARFLGHEVITDNHLGDWGTQFGKVIYGWKHCLSAARLEQAPITELVRIYQVADQRARQEPAVLEACRLELVKLQQGDPENHRIWQECVGRSRAAFAEVYTLLDVHFDEQLGESFYHPQLAGATEHLLKQGLAEESEGAIVVWDRALSEDPFIIRKSDGGFGYAATDVATLAFRLERWQPDAIWYVVGAPQHLHFAQLFALARRQGYTVELEHIAFGSILGEDRKLMRTRSGDVVDLRQLLEEAIERAARLVRDKNQALSEAEQHSIARVVGIGAVKYAELSQHRMTDYIFSWDKLLSLQGNTAPYLQNAYVRCRSIFRKLGEPLVAPNLPRLEHEAESALAVSLFRFAETVPAVLDGFRPNVLANYLYELAASFHGFYEVCPVLTAEPAVRSTRLLLCDLFARIIQLGLELLGIQVPERM